MKILESRVCSYKKPKSQVRVETGVDQAKTYIETLIMQMEIQ